jgi:ribose transport system ATP-binding protein
MSMGLSVQRISKNFDGIAALTDVSIDFAPGEIHALIGENGAGKSTLIKIITGALGADAGGCFLDGEPCRFKSVRDGLKAGVTALYQELSIVPTMTVSDNIFMGERTPRRLGVVRAKRMHAMAAEQLERLGQHDVRPTQLVSELSPVKQTMVALARALVTDARVLILDEPTAALTDQEIEFMFSILRDLRDNGAVMIYVSHRLEEIFELCDRITVMRNGEVTFGAPTSDTDIDEVIGQMVGRRPDQIFPDRPAEFGEVVLRVDGLSGARVTDVTLHARAGQILGVGGLAGSGRSELLRLLGGVQRISSGTVELRGERIRPTSVADALGRGLAYLPEERRTQGVALAQSIRDNVAMANLRSVSTGGIVVRSQETRLAHWAIRELKVKASGPDQHVGRLSGGNQQKVALAKYLAREPSVLLLDEPTRGVDVGAKVEIYDLIRRLAANGAAVIVVSSELHELIGLADRIAMMRSGRLVGEVDASGTDQEELLNYCYGRNER